MIKKKGTKDKLSAKTGGKKSLREKMEERKKRLKNSGGKSAIVFQSNEETIRVRILPLIDNNDDFMVDIQQHYLGSDIKGVISPSSFGKPCAINDAYNELKSSKKAEDKNLAKKFPPRQKSLARCLFYKDDKGKVVDTERTGKFILLAKAQAQQITDLYLDDEWGDPTDPDDGYDIKLTREGKGQLDTEYSAKACKNTPLPKAYRKMVTDMEVELAKVIPTYEETQEYIEQFLSIPPDDEEDSSDTRGEVGEKASRKKKKARK